MKSERRDGSSDGSVTEADGDDARIPAASAVPGFGWFGTPSQFSRATSGMGAGSSGEGVADGVAANAPADFGSMLGSMMANPFLAVQAAQAMHAGGWTSVNHDAMSAAAAQMAMYAQAQAAAAAGGGADASGTRAPPRKPTPPRKRSRRRGRVQPSPRRRRRSGNPERSRAAQTDGVGVHRASRASPDATLGRTLDVSVGRRVASRGGGADHRARLLRLRRRVGVRRAADAGTRHRRRNRHGRQHRRGCPGRPHRSGGARVWFLSPRRGGWRRVCAQLGGDALDDGARRGGDAAARRRGRRRESSAAAATTTTSRGGCGGGSGGGGSQPAADAADNRRAGVWRVWRDVAARAGSDGGGEVVRRSARARLSLSRRVCRVGRRRALHRRRPRLPRSRRERLETIQGFRGSRRTRRVTDAVASSSPQSARNPSPRARGRRLVS